jgi:putative sterol carrier protein
VTNTGRVRFFFTIATIVLTLGSGVVDATPKESKSSTPQDVFDGMRRSFRAEKAKGVHARYQWELSGPNGGEWWIEVNDGKFKMGKGKIENPDVTFIASDKTWVALSNGTLSGTWAYLTGRLKIRGDKGLAKKLGEIFP